MHDVLSQNAYLQFIRIAAVLQNCGVKITLNCKGFLLFNFKMNRIKLIFTFHKWQDISLPAEKLLAFPEGLRCMALLAS
jgi:hypothetical protein